MSAISQMPHMHPTQRQPRPHALASQPTPQPAPLRIPSRSAPAVQPAWVHRGAQSPAFKQRHARLLQQRRRPTSRQSTSTVVAHKPDSQYEDAEYDELADKIREVAAQVRERLGGTSVYLVGMMGCGKSTVGKLLSAALDYYFFDSDSLVEAHTEMSVAEIFEAEGEEAFREVETAVLQELAPFRNCVVATGGGAVLKRSNWGHMSHAVSIWLHGEPPLLAARVCADGKAGRPLALAPEGQKEGGDDYQSTLGRLQEILDERHTHYRVADVHVSLAHPDGDADRGAAPAVVAHRLLIKLNSRLAEKATELEEKRQAQYQVTDSTQGGTGDGNKENEDSNTSS